MDDRQMALVSKALAHPVRIQILTMLAEQDKCIGTQLFGGLPLAQSTVSQHLSTLREAGLITSHALGQGQVYCLDRSLLDSFVEAVGRLASSAPTCCSGQGEGR